MRVREHRDELLVLAGVLVVALVIGVVGFVSTDREPEPSAAPATSPTADPTADPTAAPTADPSSDPAADPSAVQLWGTPFVYACRLLTTDDVTSVFGTMGPKSQVRQQYLDRTPTASELAGAAAFSYGGLTTRCTHWFDDEAGRSLEVAVTQFPSTRLAQRRWARLAKPASGTKVGGSSDLLRLDDQGSFVTREDALLVELTLSTTKSRKHGPGRADRRAQVPLMVRAVAVVDDHLADGSAAEGPVPTSADRTSTIGGTPYVEPCAVLGDAAFSALGGPAPEPVVVDSSVVRYDPYTGAAVTSCERSGSTHTGGPRTVRTTYGVLEVRFAPSEAAARETLRRHVADRYPRSTRITRLETAVGTAYVAQVGGTRKAPMRTRAVHVAAGPYELRLAAVRDVGPRTPQGRAPSDAELTAAVEALVASLADLSPEVDVP